MYYAFMAPDMPAPKRRNRFLYFINVDRFMAEDYENAFSYDWTQGGIRLLNDRRNQYASHMFPLAVIGAGGWDLANWVQGYENHWSEIAANGDDAIGGAATQYAMNGKSFGEYLYGITHQYQVAYIELDKDLELDKVCDIFTQINSRGVRLDIFDLLNALLRPKGIRLRQDLWRIAAPRLEFADA